MLYLKSVLSVAGRVLLALVMIAIPVVSIRFGLVPMLETSLSLEQEEVTFLRRLLVLAAFLFGYWIYVRFGERRPAKELVPNLQIIVRWGLAGALLIAVPVGALFAMGFYTVTGLGILGALPAIALAILAAATIEELLFRGVLFGAVEEHFGTVVAIIFPAAIFSLLHLLNSNWGGWFSVTSGLLLGVLWTLVYMLTRNIWAAAFNHACWNFVIYLSGLPLTGLNEFRDQAPIFSDYHGPVWMTGGVAGPEDSVLVMVVVAIAVIVLYRHAKRKNLILPLL